MIGVILNYALAAKGNASMLFAGVALVALAIIINAVAYGKHSGSTGRKGVGKWIAIAVVAGILMSTFTPLSRRGWTWRTLKRRQRAR